MPAGAENRHDRQALPLARPAAPPETLPPDTAPATRPLSGLTFAGAACRLPCGDGVTAIEIFRSGKHEASSGETITFSAADLAAIATGYDAKAHLAPVVVGHPRADAPAYGWIKGLRVEGDRLVAEADQVEPQFAELVKAGRFKKVSAAFYRPDDAGNPKPGAYYLRHVGFLGAQPPAIKGLKPAEFAAGDRFVAFGEIDDSFIVRCFRRMREYIASRDGMDAADRVLPSYELDNAAHVAAQPEDDDDMSNAQFAEQQRLLDEQKRVLDAREAALKTKETTIETQGAQFAERDRTVRRTEIVAFLDALVTGGKMLPAFKPGLVAFMEALGDKPLEFAESDGKTVKSAPLDYFKTFLGSAAKVITFGEAAKAEDAQKQTRFTFAPGAAVDRGRLELHEKALSYAEKNKVTYVEAVRALDPTA
jgi:hypothetical protein